MKTYPNVENIQKQNVKYYLFWGDACVAQLVKCPTLDFGSGHDLRVVRSNHISDFSLGMEPA